MEETPSNNPVPAPAQEAAQPLTQVINFRRGKLDAEFSQIMFGTPVEAFRKVEDQAIPLARELMPMAGDIMPNAADTLHRILIRLVGLYVKKPKELINFMVPRYYDVLHTYAYGAERDVRNAEGFSDYWLYRATNQNLQLLDQVHIPGLSEHLYVNTHQVLAARSLLRLQALHFDMMKIANIEKIHAAISKVQGFRPVGYNLPDPNNFAAPMPAANAGQAPAQGEGPVNEPITGAPVKPHLDA
jgi:hypothetical protein